MSKILFENSNIEFIDGDRGKNYPKQEDFSDKGHCMFYQPKMSLVVALILIIRFLFPQKKIIN